MDEPAWPTSQSATRQLKRHCVVQLFVDHETDVYVYDLEDGTHACAGIGNIELLGSLDRIEQVVATLARQLEAVRSDPQMIPRWRSTGRVGHPNLETLATCHTGADSAMRDHEEAERSPDDSPEEETDHGPRT